MNNIHRVMIIIPLLIVLTACIAELGDPITPTPLPDATASAQNSSNPPTPTLTDKPTNTPPLPTNTPTRLFVPGPELPVLVGTPVPIPNEPITTENVDQIQELAVWGRGKINKMSFSPDGQWLAVGTTAGIWLHKAKTLELKRFIQTENIVLTLAIGPDSTTIMAHFEDDVTGRGGKTIKRWHIYSGEEQGHWQVGTQKSRHVVFSPDGKTLAAEMEGRQVTVWDIESGRLLAISPTNSDPNHLIAAIAYSADGKLLASEGRNHTIRIWEAATGKIIQTLSGHSDTQSTYPLIKQLVFSPDGTLLGSEADVMRVWHVETGELLYTLEDRVRDFTFSPDSQQLATNGQGSTAFLRDAHSGQVIHALVGHGLGASKLVYAPDGSTLAATGDKLVYLWRTDTGELQAVNEGYTRLFGRLVIAIAPNSKIITYGADTSEIEVWDVSTGQIERTLAKENDREFIYFSLSADGTTLAAKEKGTFAIWIWDLSTDEVVRVIEKQLWTYNFFPVISPDGQKLALSTGEIFDLETGTEIYDLKGGEGRNLAFSSDSKLLARGTSEGVTLWNLETGDKLFPDLLEIYNIYNETTAFSADNKLVAASDSLEGKIIVWDVENGQPLYTLVKHLNEDIRHLALSPVLDGDKANNLLVSSTRGSYHPPAVRLWDVENEQLLKTINIPTASQVRFSPDGRILILGLANGTVQLWGIPPEQY